MLAETFGDAMDVLWRENPALEFGGCVGGAADSGHGGSAFLGGPTYRGPSSSRNVCTAWNSSIRFFSITTVWVPSPRAHIPSRRRR